MTLRVVGAGLPRTGTKSLQAALERLLGARCYHMSELFQNFEHALGWRDALRGNFPDWDVFLKGYAAGVDWPVSWFWRELSSAYPDSIVLLSRRSSAESWHRSMDSTVLERRRVFARNGWDTGVKPPIEELPQWCANTTEEQLEAFGEIFQGLGGTAFPDPDDRESILALYERHLEEVRSTIPSHRLVEWEPGDDWEPLCTALGVPVPDEPFPYENRTADFAATVSRNAASA